MVLRVSRQPQRRGRKRPQEGFPAGRADGVSAQGAVGQGHEVGMEKNMQWAAA